MESFEHGLRTLKDAGVEGISSDIWWGVVEPEAHQFNWEYYKKYAGAVQKVGLKWIPILSFHSCGGNVGDSVSILPLHLSIHGENALSMRAQPEAYLRVRQALDRYSQASFTYLRMESLVDRQGDATGELSNYSHWLELHPLNRPNRVRFRSAKSQSYP